MQKVCAKVVVLSNRTLQPATAVLIEPNVPAATITIPPGDSLPYFYDTQLRIRYQERLLQREYELDESNAYFFTYGSQPRSLKLEKIGLGEKPNQGALEPDTRAKLSEEETTIRVKLLVDDDEPTHQRIWEDRLRKRFQSAAEIIERHSGVRMVVDSVDTWESQDNVTNFDHSLREFEGRVSPEPAQLAIGFSSQYLISRGRVHMGGTRGALHPYILLKERSPQVREPERLELLVHELGHYFGASHSPEPTSVMRPLIRPGLQRAVGSRIRFDPVNTLLISMVGDELRRRKHRRLVSFPLSKKQRMAEIYKVLAKASPKDKASQQYQLLLGQTETPPLVTDTRQILHHLSTAAQLRTKTQRRMQQESEDKKFLNSQVLTDGTTDFYVRQAATAAAQLKTKTSRQAFLLALGLFVDNTNTLRKFPPTSKFIQQVVADTARAKLVEKCDNPTMQGRADLAKHFFVSAFLAATVGSQVAETVGMAKELSDAQKDSGFSFADLAANRAGITFAEQVLAGKISLKRISRMFASRSFLPSVDELQEGLTLKALDKEFGGADGEAFREEVQKIEDLILGLPVYESLKQ